LDGSDTNNSDSFSDEAPPLLRSSSPENSWLVMKGLANPDESRMSRKSDEKAHFSKGSGSTHSKSNSVRNPAQGNKKNQSKRPWLPAEVWNKMTREQKKAHFAQLSNSSEGGDGEVIIGEKNGSEEKKGSYEKPDTKQTACKDCGFDHKAADYNYCDLTNKLMTPVAGVCRRRPLNQLVCLICGLPTFELITNGRIVTEQDAMDKDCGCQTVEDDVRRFCNLTGREYEEGMLIEALHSPSLAKLIGGTLKREHEINLSGQEAEVLEHISGTYRFKYRGLIHILRALHAFTYGYLASKFNYFIFNQITRLYNVILKMMPRGVPNSITYGMYIFAHPQINRVWSFLSVFYAVWKVTNWKFRYNRKVTVQHKYTVGEVVPSGYKSDARSEAANYFDSPLDPLYYKVEYSQSYKDGHCYQPVQTRGVSIPQKRRTTLEKLSFWFLSKSGLFDFYGNNGPTIPGSRHLIMQPEELVSVETVAQICGPRAQYPDREPSVIYSYLQTRLANCTAVNVSRFDEVFKGASHQSINFLYAILLARRQLMGLKDYDDL